MTISSTKELERKKHYYERNAEKIKEKRRERYAKQKYGEENAEEEFIE